MPRMWKYAACLAAACSSSSSSSPVERPVQPAAPVVAVDAAPPASPPDAGVPDEVANAPAWIFRYNAPGRVETWTLRYHGTIGLVVVEAASGTTRYIGTATDGASLQLALASGPNKLALECKRQKLAVGAKCNDTKAPKRDVLDCYHPDFKAPMTFGAEPGVEFDGTCNGYRLIAK
jgi:hypothetical protein